MGGPRAAKPYAKTASSVKSPLGAGYAKREAQGVRKRAGAPMVHGRFAKLEGKTLRGELVCMQQCENDLGNTDDALRLMYVVLDRMLTLEPDVTALQRQITSVVENTPLDPLDHLAAVAALDKLSRFLLSLHKQAVQIVKLGKVRADTRARLTQMRETDDFVSHTRLVSEILRAHISPSVFDTLMQELRVRLLGPLGLTAEDFENWGVD